MKLHYKKLGQGPPLIILHGLLGMLDNWQTLGNALSGKYEVYLLDARNHGHSPHSETMDYEVMAEDILEFIEDHHLEQVAIIGHSMGGKTAMKFSEHHPEKITRLIITDIAPKAYPVNHENIFEALHAVNLSVVKSRKEVEEILARFIPENIIRQFLLKNLYWITPEQLGWRFNITAITEQLPKLGASATGITFNRPALFIRGGKSDYIKAEDEVLIKNHFPLAEIKTIEGAGHWVHAEKPLEFLQVVMEFLGRE